MKGKVTFEGAVKMLLELFEEWVGRILVGGG
jgi:hypothetical protein